MRAPRSIIVIAWVFIVVGAAGLLNDLLPLLTDSTRQVAKLKADGFTDLAAAWTSRLVSIAGGVGLLHGRPWARWLLLAWMLFHIGLSVIHTFTQLLIHIVLFTPITYFLFRRRRIMPPPAAA